MTELKACPFCGGKARVFRLGHQRGAAFDDWGVECIKCGAMPKVYSVFQNDDQEAIYEICAKGWNQRAGDAG